MLGDNLPVVTDLPADGVRFFVIAPMEGYQDRFLLGDKEVLGQSNQFLDALYRDSEQQPNIPSVKTFLFGASISVALMVPSELADETGRRGLYLSFGVRIPLAYGSSRRVSCVAALLYLQATIELVFDQEIDLWDCKAVLLKVRDNPEQTSRQIRVIERGVEFLVDFHQLRPRRARFSWWKSLLATIRQRRQTPGLTLIIPDQPLSLERALAVVAKRCVAAWPAMGFLELAGAESVDYQGRRFLLLLDLPNDLLSRVDSVELSADRNRRR